VRLKRYLEMRGADAGPRPMLAALPAFWVGLLYDDGVLDQAWQMVRDWSAAERQALRDAVPRLGLAAPFRGEALRAVATQVLALAHEGLRRRARRDASGRDETVHLAVLDRIVAEGRTEADRLLALYQGDWKGNLDRVFETNAY
jgi:glutamate--cysteine ligase